MKLRLFWNRPSRILNRPFSSPLQAKPATTSLHASPCGAGLIGLESQWSLNPADLLRNANVRAEPSQSTTGSCWLWVRERDWRTRSMAQPIRAMTPNDRVPRNSLTRQSLVLRRCDNSLAAVPESISTIIGRKEKMKLPSEITIFDARTRIPGETEPSRPREADNR